MNPPWTNWPACPCGCGVEALKLTKHGHVVGCSCRSCIGRRNRSKGQRAQARAHRNLGGTSRFTPTHEEQGRPYVVEVCVLPEVKTGSQIPVAFDKALSSTWFERALSQSERAMPVGTGVLPAVVLRGDWLIVDLRQQKRGGSK